MSRNFFVHVNTHTPKVSFYFWIHVLWATDTYEIPCESSTSILSSIENLCCWWCAFVLFTETMHSMHSSRATLSSLPHSLLGLDPLFWGIFLNGDCAGSPIVLTETIWTDHLNQRNIVVLCETHSHSQVARCFWWLRCGQLITIFVTTHRSKTTSTMNSNEACWCLVSLHGPVEKKKKRCSSKKAFTPLFRNNIHSHFFIWVLLICEIVQNMIKGVLCLWVFFKHVWNTAKYIQMSSLNCPTGKYDERNIKMTHFGEWQLASDNHCSQSPSSEAIWGSSKNFTFRSLRKGSATVQLHQFQINTQQSRWGTKACNWGGITQSPALRTRVSDCSFEDLETHAAVKLTTSLFKRRDLDRSIVA